MYKVKIYSIQGKYPFYNWLQKVDRSTKKIILARLDRMSAGLLGDYKIIKGGVCALYEMRINHGPGYRIYFGKIRNTIIIVLCAGDKGSQTRDIAKARTYLQDYKGIE